MCKSHTAASSVSHRSLLSFVFCATGDPSQLCDSPSLVTDQHRWTIYHSKVNLPAALNDPRLAKRESDFFTKTWGVDFVDTEVTPSFYLPQITKEHFALYQQEITPVRAQAWGHTVLGPGRGLSSLSLRLALLELGVNSLLSAR